MIRREIYPRTVKCAVCGRPPFPYTVCSAAACMWYDKYGVLLDVLCLQCDEWFRGFLR